MRGKRWGPAEDEILRAHKLLSPVEISKLIPGRTVQSVKNRMYKLDYVYAKVQRSWSDEEIETLTDMWPSYPYKEIREKITRHTQHEITKKAKTLKLERLKMNPKLRNVSWPGLVGGRMAYAMSRTEAKEPPLSPPKDTSTTIHPALRELLNLFLDKR